MIKIIINLKKNKKKYNLLNKYSNIFNQLINNILTNKKR